MGMAGTKHKHRLPLPQMGDGGKKAKMQAAADRRSCSIIHYSVLEYRWVSRERSRGPSVAPSSEPKWPQDIYSECLSAPRPQVVPNAANCGALAAQRYALSMVDKASSSCGLGRGPGRSRSA